MVFYYRKGEMKEIIGEGGVVEAGGGGEEVR